MSRAEKKCQEFEDKLVNVRAELKSKETQVTSLQGQLDNKTRQLEVSQASLKKVEAEQGRAQPQTPSRTSLTPHKRDSIKIGTSADLDPHEEIAELKKKLAQRDQEMKDMEVKMWNSRF